jgi:hypothetical protein
MTWVPTSPSPPLRTGAPGLGVGAGAAVVGGAVVGGGAVVVVSGTVDDGAGSDVDVVLDVVVESVGCAPPVAAMLPMATRPTTATMIPRFTNRPGRLLEPIRVPSEAREPAPAAARSNAETVAGTGLRQGLVLIQVLIQLAYVETRV